MREIAPGVFEYGNPAPAVQRTVTVTMYQARMALLNAGLLAAAEDAIDRMPEPNRTAALLAWQLKDVISRDGPLLNAIAAVLGLTAGQVDSLFAAAAAIPPV